MIPNSAATPQSSRYIKGEIFKLYNLFVIQNADNDDWRVKQRQATRIAAEIEV